MALQCDDCDIREAYCYMFVGGNGDYYLNLVEYPEDKPPKAVTVRVAMSGGFAPLSVKLAIANLYRELEAHGLNVHPKDVQTF